MRWALIRWAVPAAALATLWLVAGSARAEGEACLRDTECVGGEVCLDQACAVPQTEPLTCEGGCAFDEACVDGFCKRQGVTCNGPGGRCWVEQDFGACECAAGDGAGWSDGFNPDDPPEELSDEELFDECTTVLADTCGTEAPTLPDACQGDVLAECEAVVDVEIEAGIDCGVNPPVSTIARVGNCCEGFDDPGAEDWRRCVLAAAEAPACELFETCAEQSGPGEGEAGNDGDTDGGSTDPTGAAAADEDADASKSACTVGGTAPAWLLALGLLGLRRRRPGTASGPGDRARARELTDAGSH